MRHFIAVLAAVTSFTATHGALRGYYGLEAPNEKTHDATPDSKLEQEFFITANNNETRSSGHHHEPPIALNMSEDVIGGDHARNLATGYCGIFAQGEYFHPQAGKCYSLGGTWWNDKVTWIRASSNTCIKVWEHHGGGRNQQYCGSNWLPLMRELSKEVSLVCCGSTEGDNSGEEEADNAWLTAHNSRRQKYHAKYGVSYVPLKWSNSLAASAQDYANQMARTGVFKHSNGNYGENLAWNSGSSSRSAENVLTRWVENEEREWGGHFTAALWRATKYVGCAVATSGHGSYQVCQYVTPGNCNGSSKGNMLASSSPCSPQCPPEGCF